MSSIYQLPTASGVYSISMRSCSFDSYVCVGAKGLLLNSLQVHNGTEIAFDSDVQLRDDIQKVKKEENDNREQKVDANAADVAPDVEVNGKDEVLDEEVEEKKEEPPIDEDEDDDEPPAVQVLFHGYMMLLYVCVGCCVQGMCVCVSVFVCWIF